MASQVMSSGLFEKALACVGAAGSLSKHDVEALSTLNERVEVFSAGAQVQTARRERLRLVTSGWTYEARLLPDGRRQIFHYLLPGDLISARYGAGAARGSLIALTRLECAEIPPSLLSGAGGERTRLAEGLDRVLDSQMQRTYEAVLRLGQFTAQEGMANFLIDLRDRLTKVGLADRFSFRCPLTQEHLADTLGLSVIHVNRVLRQLRTEGLLVVKLGQVTFLDPNKMEMLAAGNPIE
ncbi:Crp/Fnr family transcriptional regulator [Phenylobacterium sp.]|jgi:CRP-like cAMP-binding protein|uniref:Crp/Fnr family transcriptional regulator n=1 Tax=Phenylobacterium sp. TaxID=1871053 RepID=UPI003783767A